MSTVYFFVSIRLGLTRVKSIFGMNFFDFTPKNGAVVSDQIWIFWAVLIACIIVFSIVWCIWQRLERRRWRAADPSDPINEMV